MLLRLRQICSHASLVQEDGLAFVIGDDEDDENLDGDAKEELARARKEVSSEFVARMKHKLREIMIARVKAEKEVRLLSVQECCTTFSDVTNADFSRLPPHSPRTLLPTAMRNALYASIVLRPQSSRPAPIHSAVTASVGLVIRISTVPIAQVVFRKLSGIASR